MFNKVDLPEANIDRVLTELTEYGLVPEQYGGDIITCNISAKKGDGVPELLETLLLVSEMAELKANPNRYATGTVPFVMDIYFDAFSLKQAGLATAKAMVLFVVIVLVTGIQLFTMKRKEVEA